jgi:hypothetical protein
LETETNYPYQYIKQELLIKDRECKMKRKLLFFTVLLFSVFLRDVSGSPDTVRFVNTGKMAVAATGTAAENSLLIPSAVWMTGNSSIRQDGITSIGGNFYQDALTNVFYKDGGSFASVGKIVFFLNNGLGDTGTRRYVTAKSGDMNVFDRSSRFVAFPEIEIRTKDTVVIPARMGIDARRLIRSGGSYGKLWLESKAINDGSGDKSYDASLRITGPMDSTSAQLVPPGSVVIERDLTPYRVEDGSTGNGTLFAFASPFKAQRSGYFAGNWLRRMLEDTGNNSHVQFIYGNKRGGDDVILPEQYIIDPTEEFLPGKGHLVKLRAANFDYSQLTASGGLAGSGGNASDYNVSKFVFNGAPYQMDAVDEQVFADSVLFKRNINLAAGVSATYINWVIGNSWTAPISITSLVNLMGSSPLYFEPFIYVFPNGSTNYQVYKCQTSENGMQIIDIDEIPAMSYFMVRLDNTRNQTGTFTLRRNELLTHGNASHSTLKAASLPYNNEVLFRVGPASNPNIYDLAGIGLRRNGNPNADGNDILKPGDGEGGELFSLYALSDDGRRLSASIVPETAEAVPLCFSPGTSTGAFRLEASRIESLRTEGLWLEDKKEGTVTDLLQSNGSYGFEVSAGDSPDRFTVHFQPMAATTLEALKPLTPLKVYCTGNEIIVTGLVDDDAGSRLLIYDAQGQLLHQATVTQAPEMRLPVSLSEGVYIFRLQGKRVFTLKFRR